MRRILGALLALVFVAWAANVKLYMKDGSFHIVKEYQVQQDRVRFYSVERSQWEEIPLDLVDLDRTKAEASAHQAELDKEAKLLSEQDRVQREREKEVMKIPENPGVYWLEGPVAKNIRAAEVTVKTNKGRSVLKALAPIPLVPGKGTVEIPLPHSTNIFTNPAQEFYIQLTEQELFGIIKVAHKGNLRIVENISIMPVSNEVVENPETVEIFQKELTGNGLYKIWPKEPLADGEYAVVEYTPGKLNMQVFDFAMKQK
jgi:hypothetical protein